MKDSSLFLAGAFLSLSLVVVGCGGGGEDTDGTGGASSGGNTTSEGGAAMGGSSAETGGTAGLEACDLQEVRCGDACLAVGESSGGCQHLYSVPNFYYGSPLKLANDKIYLGTPELHSMNLDGSSLTKLSDMSPESIAVGAETIYAIGWLPRSVSVRSLFKLPVSGGVPTSLGDTYLFAKDLTLVGERLYFRRTVAEGAGLDFEIVSVDLDGTNEVVHTPRTVRSRFAASDEHLYFYNYEEADGVSVHSIARTPLLSEGVEVVVPEAQGRALTWSDGVLYYVHNGLFAYDTGNATNAQLRTSSDFGTYPSVGVVHEGAYVGLGGTNLVLPLDGGPRVFLPTVDVGLSDAFISGGKVYVFALSHLVVLDLP